MTSQPFRPWSWFTKKWTWGTHTWKEGDPNPDVHHLALGYLQMVTAAVEESSVKLDTMAGVILAIRENTKKVEGDDLSRGHLASLSFLIGLDPDMADRTVNGMSPEEISDLFNLMRVSGCSRRSAKVVWRFLTEHPFRYNDALVMTSDEWMERKNCGVTSAAEIVKFFKGIRDKFYRDGRAESLPEVTHDTVHD